MDEKAVFIERDGVLVTVRSDAAGQIAPLTLKEFEVNLTCAPDLSRLKKAGFIVIATTNQPALSDNRLSRTLFDKMHKLLLSYLPLDGILFCPHLEKDNCFCRKPGAGMLIDAAHKWRLNLDHSFVISDKWQDAEMARMAGCTSILIKSPWISSVRKDFLVNDFNTAASKIIALTKHNVNMC